VREIEVPGSFETLEDGCFSSSRQLEKFAFVNPFTSKLSRIGSATFGSSALTQIGIPNSVVAIQGPVLLNIASSG
jgi:hypothetical protein